MKENYTLLVAIIISNIAISYIMNRVPYSKLASLRLFLATCDWEDGGEIYNRLFRIRCWKDHVPSVGPFDKKVFAGDRKDYISLFILETVRAEAAHYLCLFAAFTLCALWKGDTSCVIPIFFVLINVPCIMIQRYNRPRFERMLMRQQSPLLIPQDRPSPSALWRERWLQR